MNHSQVQILLPKIKPSPVWSVLEQDQPPEQSPEPEPITDTGPTEGQSQPSTSKNLQEDPPKSLISLLAAERIANDCISWIMKILKKCIFHTKGILNFDEMKAVIRCLTDVVVDNITST